MVEQSRFGKLSRRDSLKILGVAALTLFVGTNSAKSAEPAIEAPETEPGFGDFIEGAKKVEDPTLRAATVLVSSPFGWGHAGLYREAGNYYLVTIQHVTFSLLGSFNCSLGGIGGRGREIRDSVWEYLGRDSDSSFDPNMRHKINSDFAREIESYVAAGEIKPLEMAHDISSIQTGDRFCFPLPDVGKKGLMKYTGYDQGHDLMVFEGQKGYVCGGFSGLPVLETDRRGKMSGRSVGLIRGVSHEEANGCSEEIFFVKPHFPLPS